MARGALRAGIFLQLLAAALPQTPPQQHFWLLPDNVTVAAGEDVVLKCGVRGRQGHVQWVKDGFGLGPNPEIPGFPRYRMTGSPDKGEFHLHISKCDITDDAEFECQVSRSESSPELISPRIMVTVLVPPKVIQMSPEAGSLVTWVAGEEYSVTCTSGESKPEAKIIFHQDHWAVPDVFPYTNPGSQEKFVTTEATVRVTPKPSDNGKLLTCEVNHPALKESLKSSFTMNILFPPGPPVIEWPGQMEGKAKAGEDLELPCVSRGGNPLATLQWLKNGKVISTVWETDHKQALARSILPLTIQPEDNGAQLSCEAQNSVSPGAQQHVITLRVTCEDPGAAPAPLPPAESPRSRASQRPGPLSASLLHSSPGKGAELGEQPSETLGPPSEEGADTASSHSIILGSPSLEETSKPFPLPPAQNRAVLARWLGPVWGRPEIPGGQPFGPEGFAKETLKKSVTLNVKYPIQKLWIETFPPGDSFRAGNQVRLLCLAIGGNPDPSLSWCKDKKLVVETRPGAERRPRSAVEKSGSTLSRELVLRLDPSDNQAVYTCKTTSNCKAPGDPATASEVPLQWSPAGVPPTGIWNAHSDRGPLNLTCVSLSSNPPVNLSWEKEGERGSSPRLHPREGCPAILESTHFLFLGLEDSSEKTEDQIPIESEFPGWFLLPILFALGVLLLLSNVSCIGYVLWRQKHRGLPSEGTKEEKSEEGSETRTGNEYEESQWSGRRTPSTAESSAEMEPYYHSMRDFSPQLPPTPEEEPQYRGFWGHEYEEVAGPGPVYDEVERLYPLSGAWEPPYQGTQMGTYQYGEWPHGTQAAPAEPGRIYDLVSEDLPGAGDNYLPFHLRGELV
ncbi:nephrin [Sarcophilus harrisii]|uniref:nephrin n=1 Tax=Sarcophilus harrisii TaxID=9305 RepID=UPI001301C514|nr:nephrin [Sarcophilus harrisii]